MTDIAPAQAPAAAPAPEHSQPDTAMALLQAFQSDMDQDGETQFDDPQAPADESQVLDEPAEPAGKWEFDEAALERPLEIKINGEVKELPLKEVIRLASLAEGSHQRLQQAAEERKRLVSERNEMEATQAEIGEVMRNPARFFSEMLMSDVDAVGYVTNLVSVAQTWLGKTETERAMMLREERHIEREAQERKALEQRTQQAERQAVDKVLSKAGVPDYLSDFVRAKVEQVVEQYRGKRTLKVSELVEYAKKQAGGIEERARARLAEEQKKTAPAAPVKPAAPKPLVGSAPQVDRNQQNGQFEKSAPRVDPFNPRSIRSFIR